MKKLILSFLVLTLCKMATAQSVALDFDGSNDRVEAVNASSLVNGSTTISVAFWINPSTPGTRGFAGFRNNTNADFYILGLSATNVEARFRNSTGTNFDIVGTGMTLNSWQHYVMTYDGSTLRLYRNGIMIGSTAATGTFSAFNNAFHIGALPWAASYFWSDGRMDDISLWSKTLSATEINCMYNYGVDTSASGLELYYSCDQNAPNKNNSGKVTLDDAMGNINGTLSGFTLSGNASNWVTGYQTNTYLTDDICDGDSLMFGGLYRKAKGNYRTSFGLGSSCDSIVQLYLNVRQPQTKTKNQTICEGDSVEFNGQYVMNEGTYTATFTSRFGCDSTSIVNLDVDSVNTGFTLGGKVLASLAQGATYQWYNCDGDSVIPGETNQTFQFTDHATYAVIVTQNNCTDTSDCLYTALGIDDYLKNQVSLYPNPARGSLNVKGITSSTEIVVYDITLREVKRKTMSFDTQINVSDLEPGTYYFRMLFEQKVEVQRIIIE